MKLTNGQHAALMALGWGPLAMATFTSPTKGAVCACCAQFFVDEKLAEVSHNASGSRVFVTLNEAGRKTYLQFAS